MDQSELSAHPVGCTCDQNSNVSYKLGYKYDHSMFLTCPYASMINAHVAGKSHRRFSCFILEEKPESGLDTVDSQLDNIGGRITTLYSKMCWELGADLQVQDFPAGAASPNPKKGGVGGGRCQAVL